MKKKTRFFFGRFVLRVSSDFLFTKNETQDPQTVPNGGSGRWQGSDGAFGQYSVAHCSEGGGPATTKVVFPWGLGKGSGGKKTAFNRNKKKTKNVSFGTDFFGKGRGGSARLGAWAWVNQRGAWEGS